MKLVAGYSQYFYIHFELLQIGKGNICYIPTQNISIYSQQIDLLVVMNYPISNLLLYASIETVSWLDGFNVY